jgi:hypothetical protein
MVRLGVLAIVACLASSLANAESWEQKLPQQTREWLANGDLTSELDLIVENTSRRYLTGTPYAGRLRINMPPEPNTATFLMVRRSALGRLNSNLTCTCSVALSQEAVVCDADFVNDFLDVVNTRDDQESDTDDIKDALQQLDQGYRLFLSNWLIGHEVGHLVLQHHSSSAADERRTPDAPQSGPDASTLRWGREEELEADGYVLARISRSEIQFSAFMTLSQLATSLYARLIELQHPEELRAAIAADKNPIFGTMFPIKVRFSQSRHPPWFIRVLDMADLLFKHYPTMVDTSGYWKNLRAQIEPVDVGARQPKDWACAENLTGLPAKPLDGKSLIGDAELVDRLIELNDGPLLASRLAALHDEAMAEGQDLAWADTYSLLVEADSASRNGRVADTNSALQKAAPYFDGTRADDLSLLVLYARTLARAGGGAEQAKLIEALLPRIDAAATEMSTHFSADPRQLQIYYLDMWEVLSRARALDDPTTEGIRDALVGSLAEDAHDIVARDFVTRWKQAIKQLQAKGDEAGTELVINQLLAFAGAASALGLEVDAIRANREALRLLDEKMPEQLPVRAYWNDNLARLLMNVERGACAPTARSALALRQEILELVKVQTPDHTDEAVGQVGIAANQLGFCHILGLEWKEAVEALELSLRLELSRPRQDEGELATVRHNLALAYVALGDQRALELARLALADRERLKLAPVLIENSRSLVAAALYLDGQKAESVAAIRTWQEHMTEIDDFRSPTDDLLLIIDGKKVGLRELLGETNVVSNRIKLGGPAAFDYSGALSENW